ncbi:hypothetical protein K227x_45520 [Rubripirellula lacrimiformis]|uniref:Uncharacterized protein n=1 Tax=Rubripirellula lacrimiformis TaxID=1930273 RepID=A0A517NG83_9BACT|nr:hypothetical protein [Rubripirellula lacrimiformis]QDT06144.1 hypothetical protein K227x_45520 [Rubripirellula lacrimiformis]
MKSHQLLAGALAIGIAAGSTGCATVVSERRYPVTIDNPPAPTYFSIYNRKNEVVHQGVTPQQVTLDAKAFPFWPAKYTVVLSGTDSTSQRQELKATLDPWFAGNILIGGGAGAVVDGATGAMFRLPPRVAGNVAPQYAVVEPNMGSMLATSEMTKPDQIGKPGSAVSSLANRSAADILPVSASMAAPGKSSVQPIPIDQPIRR